MILKQPIFYVLITFLILIVALNFFAFQYFWYWKINWFDLLMHFLGGLFIGLSALWIYPQVKKLDQPRSFLTNFFTAETFALMVGGLWESFEFKVDQYWATHINIKTFQILQNGQLDSFSDLLFDVLGALAATLVIFLVPSLIHQVKEIRQIKIDQYDQNKGV